MGLEASFNLKEQNNFQILNAIFVRDNIKHSATSGIICWEMVKNGLGVGLVPDDIGENEPEVMKLLPELEVIKVPVWLVTHRELRTSQRIRLVYDFLSDYLSKKSFLEEGEAITNNVFDNLNKRHIYLGDKIAI